MGNENHPDGYRKHRRKPIGKRDPIERSKDNEEIWSPNWSEENLKNQGERCMDCGVPTCIGGCPIGNIIPDWNDLVYRNNWKTALEELHATNNFPEFTGYTCPAPCEDACVLKYNDDPVSIKSIERAIVDKGWEEGWIKPEPPGTRTEYKVAIVGSGPAGLAAAQQLNRVGHNITVYEKDDEIGGLMTYGIPEFKFSKKKVKRRIDQLKKEGINFEKNTEIGNDVSSNILIDEYDASCIAIGSQKHVIPPIEGIEKDGIHLAMDYLTQENKRQLGNKIGSETISAKDNDVVVLGGGDTGSDCVATAHRQGANQVVQIEINIKPPNERPNDNPWPEQPQKYKKTYAQREGGKEEYAIDTKEFLDKNQDGHVDSLLADRVEWKYDEEGNRIDKKVLVNDIEISADLVLIAVGFSGPEIDPFNELGLETSELGTIKTDEKMMTNVDGVFAAGDANKGPSLVVWAIGEGRDVAKNIDKYLTGRSDLPSSIDTYNSTLYDLKGKIKR